MRISLIRLLCWLGLCGGIRLVALGLGPAGTALRVPLGTGSGPRLLRIVVLRSSRVSGVRRLLRIIRSVFIGAGGIAAAGPGPILRPLGI